MRANSRELTIAAGVILFGSYVVFESLRMPRYEHLQANPYSVPGLVPGVIGAIVIVLGIVMVLREIVNARRKEEISSGGLVDVQEVEVPASIPLGEQPWMSGNVRLFITAVLALTYALGMVGRMDFALATGIFVFLFITIFEYRPDMSKKRVVRMILVALLQAVLVGVAVVFVFERIFLVRLP